MKESIQVANKDKLEAIVDMAMKLWPEDNKKELIEEFIEILEGTKEDILLYVVEGKAIGFIHVAIRVDYVEGMTSSPTGYIEGIFVEEEYRMQGIARKLVKAGEVWAREKGCRQMGSDVELHNEKSMMFHRAIGYDEVNRVVCFIKEV